MPNVFVFLRIFEASELAVFHGDNSPAIAKKGGDRKITLAATFSTTTFCCILHIMFHKLTVSTTASNNPTCPSAREKIWLKNMVTHVLLPPAALLEQDRNKFHFQQVENSASLTHQLSACPRPIEPYCSSRRDREHGNRLVNMSSHPPATTKKTTTKTPPQNKTHFSSNRNAW